MKANLTKLLDIQTRIKREDVPDNTTDGSRYVPRVEGTSPYQPYSFEIDEAAGEDGKSA